MTPRAVAIRANELAEELTGRAGNRAVVDLGRNYASVRVYRKGNDKALLDIRVDDTGYSWTTPDGPRSLQRFIPTEAVAYWINDDLPEQEH